MTLEKSAVHVNAKPLDSNEQISSSNISLFHHLYQHLNDAIQNELNVNVLKACPSSTATHANGSLSFSRSEDLFLESAISTNANLRQACVQHIRTDRKLLLHHLHEHQAHARHQFQSKMKTYDTQQQLYRLQSEQTIDILYQNYLAFLDQLNDKQDTEHRRLQELLFESLGEIIKAVERVSNRIIQQQDRVNAMVACARENFQWKSFVSRMSFYLGTNISDISPLISAPSSFSSSNNNNNHAQESLSPPTAPLLNDILLPNPIFLQIQKVCQATFFSDQRRRRRNQKKHATTDELSSHPLPIEITRILVIRSRPTRRQQASAKYTSESFSSLSEALRHGLTSPYAVDEGEDMDRGWMVEKWNKHLRKVRKSSRSFHCHDYLNAKFVHSFLTDQRHPETHELVFLRPKNTSIYVDVHELQTLLKGSEELCNLPEDCRVFLQERNQTLREIVTHQLSHDPVASSSSSGDPFDIDDTSTRDSIIIQQHVTWITAGDAKVEGIESVVSGEQCQYFIPTCVGDLYFIDIRKKKSSTSMSHTSPRLYVGIETLYSSPGSKVSSSIADSALDSDLSTKDFLQCLPPISEDVLRNTYLSCASFINNKVDEPTSGNDFFQYSTHHQDEVQSPEAQYGVIHHPFANPEFSSILEQLKGQTATGDYHSTNYNDGAFPTLSFQHSTSSSSLMTGGGGGGGGPTSSVVMAFLIQYSEGHSSTSPSSLLLPKVNVNNHCSDLSQSLSKEDPKVRRKKTSIKSGSVPRYEALSGFCYWRACMATATTASLTSSSNSNVGKSAPASKTLPAARGTLCQLHHWMQLFLGAETLRYLPKLPSSLHATTTASSGSSSSSLSNDVAMIRQASSLLDELVSSKLSKTITAFCNRRSTNLGGPGSGPGATVSRDSRSTANKKNIKTSTRSSNSLRSNLEHALTSVQKEIKRQRQCFTIEVQGTHEIHQLLENGIYPKAELAILRKEAAAASAAAAAHPSTSSRSALELDLVMRKVRLFRQRRIEAEAETTTNGRDIPVLAQYSHHNSNNNNNSRIQQQRSAFLHKVHESARVMEKTVSTKTRPTSASSTGKSLRSSRRNIPPHIT